MTDHTPHRPTWDCRLCGGEWPCDQARLDLLAEYDGARVSLAIYLGACLVEATRELFTVPAGWLYARFLGWMKAPLPAHSEVRESSDMVSDKHAASA
ncbi:hypothetical protein ACIA8K_36750 [Catenuloplanes sp. NPDC051500]|uniref:hypothetical protein n=1 Tax=Catenuloplanes sp. NPDC051500 TaxID=3363959 RepID=UPI0037B5AA88